MHKKHQGNGKDFYVASMDLEKANDKTTTNVMWQALQVYRVLRVMKSFYKESKTFVTLGREEGKCSPVKVTQGSF